jgi:hypothetical protein
MNKKIILLSAMFLIVVSLTVVGSLFYLHSKQFNNIKENGVSFEYPKGLEIKKDGPTEGVGYISYSIKTKFKYDQSSFKESYISIGIPTRGNKNEGGLYTLENLLNSSNLKKEDYIIPIKEVNINGHKGEMAKFRIDRKPEGDIATHSVFTYIFLDSKYSNAPIILEYENKDTDPNSLDKVWETILKTLKY